MSSLVWPWGKSGRSFIHFTINVFLLLQSDVVDMFLFFTYRRTQTRKSTSNNDAKQAIPNVDLPSFSGLTNSADTREIDYLSGDIYTSDTPFGTHKYYPSAPPSPFRYDELASLGPPAYRETQAAARVAPTDAKNEQRQFIEKQGDSSFSYENLFISHRSTPSRDEESEDALFRDLVDFAKARASPSSSKRNRS